MVVFVLQITARQEVRKQARFREEEEQERQR